MTYLITYFDHYGKYAYYSGIDIHDLYCYLDVLEYPTKLTYSDQNSHSFYLKTNTESVSQHTFIATLIDRKSIICYFCGLPGHNSDS